MFYDYTDTENSSYREGSVPVRFWNIPAQKKVRRIKSPVIRRIIYGMRSQGCKLEVMIIKEKKEVIV